MEMQGILKAFHSENDASGLHHVAKALVLLQRKYGTPSKVFGKGQAARHVYELMEAIKNETGGIKHQVTTTHFLSAIATFLGLLLRQLCTRQRGPPNVRILHMVLNPEACCM